MRTIKAVPITIENFRPYGSFASIVNPEGNCFPGDLSDFYPDQVELNIQGGKPVTFSALTTRKPERMIITQSEYHNFTGEGIFPVDDDVILHLAVPSKHTPIPEKTECFIVPKGTMVKINTGVWHMAPIPVNKEEAHVLIILPERVYGNDCCVFDYDADQQFEIVL